ncbi:MAG: hypothetical protein IJE91_02895 [Clostridia bacterium]|nr:hypothetical protein [Clostridia bacterium]
MVITDFIGVNHEINGCLGCALNNNPAINPCGIIYKNNSFSVSQDIELPINGFIILTSNRHIEKFTELTMQEVSDLGALITKCLNIMRSNGVAEEFNIVLEEKAGSHFHVWLMPRHKWMLEKFGKVLKNIKPIQEYAIKNLKTPEQLKQIKSTCKLLSTMLNAN